MKLPTGLPVCSSVLHSKTQRCRPRHPHRPRGWRGNLHTDWMNAWLSKAKTSKCRCVATHHCLASAVNLVNSQQCGRQHERSQGLRSTGTSGTTPSPHYRIKGCAAQRRLLPTRIERPPGLITLSPRSAGTELLPSVEPSVLPESITLPSAKPSPPTESTILPSNAPSTFPSTDPSVLPASFSGLVTVSSGSLGSSVFSGQPSTPCRQKPAPKMILIFPCSFLQKVYWLADAFSGKDMSMLNLNVTSSSVATW